MKILVIDDEKPTLSMFKLFLTAYGYEVQTAESGEDGLAAFAAFAPDIVFTDIRMPGIDGLSVLRQIRSQAPACQVIIITGHGDMERAVEALDLDASDFINKPVERQALNAALVRAERRAAGKAPADLSIEASGSEIVIRGKLTGAGRAALTAALSTMEGRDEIAFRLHRDFSMDRQGISLFMDTLKDLNEKGIRLNITEVSYNYQRFFEMAGIHKMARIQAAETEEPGL